MALFDDDQRKVLLGVAIGAAAVGLFRGVRPAFKGLGRPFAKATIKSGITLLEKGREKLAQMAEVFDDLVAEAKAELEQETRGAEAGAAPANPETVQ